ncbi:hypothetical protein JB92DRAFT_3095131 [Gautieria morchelliformis]|nr:hypothetical protein JB92DRAFT_3095131 [Gautieria morchelliformis]
MSGRFWSPWLADASRLSIMSEVARDHWTKGDRHSICTIYPEMLDVRRESLLVASWHRAVGDGEWRCERVKSFDDAWGPSSKDFIRGMLWALFGVSNTKQVQKRKLAMSQAAIINTEGRKAGSNMTGTNSGTSVRWPRGGSFICGLVQRPASGYYWSFSTNLLMLHSAQVSAPSPRAPRAQQQCYRVSVFGPWIMMRISCVTAAPPTELQEALLLYARLGDRRTAGTVGTPAINRVCVLSQSWDYGSLIHCCVHQASWSASFGSLDRYCVPKSTKVVTSAKLKDPDITIIESYITAIVHLLNREGYRYISCAYDHDPDPQDGRHHAWET